MLNSVQLSCIWIKSSCKIYRLLCSLFPVAQYNVFYCASQCRHYLCRIHMHAIEIFLGFSGTTSTTLESAHGLLQNNAHWNHPNDTKGPVNRVGLQYDTSRPVNRVGFDVRYASTCKYSMLWCTMHVYIIRKSIFHLNWIFAKNALSLIETNHILNTESKSQFVQNAVYWKVPSAVLPHPRGLYYFTPLLTILPTRVLGIVPQNHGTASTPLIEWSAKS